MPHAQLGLGACTLACALAFGGCSGNDETTAPPARVHPHLMVTPAERAVVLARIDREPYAAMLAWVRDVAARSYEDDPDPLHWDSGANGRNAETAQANALIAWLFDDAAAADKARDFLARLETDWETNTVWDINIRMPHTLLGYANAWDLLMATPGYPAEESAAAAAKLTDINRKFFAKYLENGVFRGLLLGPTQNNHPIRTAVAIGYVALAFPEDPDARKWANWAASELDYLWGPKGHYVQPDGGVSEGPFYFGFAWGVSAAFFVAMRNTFPEPPSFERDCRNRVDFDPWADHGCVEGEPFTWQDPLVPGSRFELSAAWSLALRLPRGARPPEGDAYFNAFNGGALLSSFGGDGTFRWDWESNLDEPYAMTHGADLVAHHLAYFDDAVAATEPDFTTRFMPDAGHAVFRSDWSPDARWLLLLAEHGDVRKTVHDHVDGTSFSLAAYGEYLLIDPGYYKPEETDNAKTAHSPSHNVVLIDGRSAPDKGLLTDFGDADAFLRNTHDGSYVEYAEAQQDYQETHVERSVVFVGGRYFVVADRLATTHTTPRAHAFRLHGWAGHGSGGVFLPGADGARWERPLAGVDVRVACTEPGMAVVEPAFVDLMVPHVQEFDLARTVTTHGVIDAGVTALAPSFLSLLLPYRVGAAPGADDAPLASEAIDLGAGVVGWLVHTAGATDLAVLRRPGAPASLQVPGGPLVDTDAELALVRIVGGPPFAVMARGTSLALDGVVVASALDPSGVVVEE
ncbi:MAG: heparinase II/III family protein [Polyangiaceae bacterium]|nr:heparinase II/III family protein [Polyangiaceae bacterium]